MPEAFCAALVMLAGLPATAHSGVQESLFFVSPDGVHVQFDVRDVPRREVMEKLFAGRSIKFEWLNPALADETITGAFHGSAAAVVRQLLTQANFVVVYDRTGEKPTISRVVVVGKSSGQQSSSGLAAIEGAMQQPLPPSPPAQASLPLQASPGNDLPIRPVPAGQVALGLVPVSEAPPMLRMDPAAAAATLISPAPPDTVLSLTRP